MVYLNQQTANTMSLHRMTSDVIKKRVTKMKQRVDRFVYTLIDVEQRGWSSSITTTIKGDHSISSFPLDITQTQSSPLNLHDSPSYFNHLQQKRKTADDTILNTIHLLYLYDQLIYESECSILEEKKTTFDNFIQCMQSVSKIEQSVMQIYPRLAELEKRMKQLRFEIEYGQGAIARKVITGYGILLCEVWRRSTYSELIMKNTNLLGDLFEHFKKREDDYRKNFIENEVICLEQKEDKLFVSLHHVDDNKKRRAILPFIIQVYQYLMKSQIEYQ
ncbi:uncharacterized protein BX663DRAFT_252536 [Cokeromyces recurvatus]|uniref:uncharacterized protein n=1 Tax=Cokeromyces recurvatus TaxID=90255 RepID=UPI0022205150|nr:uncharacterized protein BX663DRAFT_252536 [Cokeromyces recurvatus]KAI7906120.1 hypothetical protein BX663DRAFT_252536 [Cokeromyces recurvatus]